MHGVDAVVTQIVEAAYRHFLSRGYSRVSTAEIARSIGRSKKTLYKHFATKRALLHAVLCRLDAESGREISGLLAGRDGDRVTRLRRILTATAVHLATTHQVFFADLRASDPELADQARRERRQSLMQILHPLLAEAVDGGSVRADLPVEQMLATFFSCVEGLALPGEAAQSLLPPDQRFAALVDLLVDGMRRR